MTAPADIRALAEAFRLAVREVLPTGRGVRTIPVDAEALGALADHALAVQDVIRDWRSVRVGTELASTPGGIADLFAEAIADRMEARRGG